MCILCALACQCASLLVCLHLALPSNVFFLEKKGSDSAISSGLILGIAVAIVLVLAVAGELCCCNILISD